MIATVERRKRTTLVNQGWQLQPWRVVNWWRGVNWWGVVAHREDPPHSMPTTSLPVTIGLSDH